MKTSVALTAQAIRKDLKAAYPETKFIVRSKNYTGGDSIDVSYIATVNGPKESEVEALLSKYEEGHFDGMTDMYEYKPREDRSPLGTKYLFVNADLDQLRSECKDAFMKDYGLTSDSDQEARAKTGDTFYYSLSRYIRSHVLA